MAGTTTKTNNKTKDKEKMNTETLKQLNEVTKPLIILSLGAGVQSSTLALMAARGEVIERTELEHGRNR